MSQFNQTIAVFLLLISSLPFIYASTVSVKLSRKKIPTNSPYRTFLQHGMAINLTNQQNVQYTGAVMIGSSDQSFNLLFDTASPWLCVLPSNSNNSYFGTKFDCLQSTTCTKVAKSGGQYVQGSFYSYSKNQKVSGDVAWDNIAFKDFNSSLNQSFLLLNDQSSILIDTSYADGICGLSPKNDQGLQSLVDRLYESGLIKSRTFSMYLNNNAEAFEEEDSEILFGGINQQYYVDEFMNVSALDKSYYWEVNLQSTYLTAQNKSASIRLNAKTAILDSGTNYITMTIDDFLKITYAFKVNFGLDCHFNSDKSYLCSCPDGDLSNFPNLTFVLDSQPLSIPPSLYLQVKENYCVLLIQGTLFNIAKSDGQSNNSSTDNGNNASVILGTPFLRTFYTVFDSENMRISFAKAATLKVKTITALEILYLAFGIFILIMFVILVICTIKIWTLKGKPSKKDNKVYDSGSIDVGGGSEITYSRMQT